VLTLIGVFSYPLLGMSYWRVVSPPGTLFNKPEYHAGKYSIGNEDPARITKLFVPLDWRPGWEKVGC
jgi:hypothetical protein